MLSPSLLNHKIDVLSSPLKMLAIAKSITKNCDSTKQNYASTALNALQKISYVFLKSQSKHNNKDHQFGEIHNRHR
jgi:hypothetical protein